MRLFFFIAVLVYGSMHFYALRKVWKAFPPSKGLLAVLTLGGALLTLSPLFIRFLERNDWHRTASVFAWVSYTWMGFLVLFISLALVLDAARGIGWLAKIKWPLTSKATLAVLGSLSLALTCYAFFEASHIAVERLTIRTPKLKSGSIRIVQLSDLHLGVTIKDRFLKRVLDMVDELKPDILVATGDIVDGQGDDLNSLSQYFAPHQPRLGMLAVTGNHEYIVGLDHSLRFLHKAGFTVLRGGAVKTGGVVFVGVDDYSRANQQQPAFTDTRKALEAIKSDDFVILLKHRPEVDSTLPFDLQLSGHTHGGQIFPITIPAQLINGVPTGRTPLPDGSQLYVSRGVGTWGPPMRFLSQPEITLITIQSSHE